MPEVKNKSLEKLWDTVRELEKEYRDEGPGVPYIPPKVDMEVEVDDFESITGVPYMSGTMIVRRELLGEYTNHIYALLHLKILNNGIVIDEKDGVAYSLYNVRDGKNVVYYE